MKPVLEGDGDAEITVQVQSMMDDAFQPGRQNYWKSNFLSDLDDKAIEIIVDHFGKRGLKVTRPPGHRTIRVTTPGHPIDVRRAFAYPKPR